mmetsp:Transcript_2124/g.2404  ORF Transcript_2124/g.2404 Transcript_2124/m.2404 type:complete len:809 (+) Transcript_2124:49-2475(+)
MSVVGIDFGGQNSVIAAAGRGGVDVILNGNSNRLNASMVGFNECRSMGETASITASSNFRNTIKNMKRLIGLAFDDPRAQAEMKRVPFTCIPMKHSNGGPDSIGVKVNLNSEEITTPIEAVAGMLIKHMGSIVKDAAPADWVVTIPGYYTDAQRRALLAGCQIVGVNGVQRLMHEHTAAALAFGIFKDIRKEFKKDEPTNIMFIDIGETAYSCSISSFVTGKFVVKTAQFDQDLGGREFDLKIAEWIAQKFEEKYKGKLSAKPMDKPKVVIKLLGAAEKAKKTLSPAGVKEARINLESLMDDLDFNILLTASEYEDMCAPLLARLNSPIERALEETGLTTKDLASIEILGGGSRVGCVKRTLAKILDLDSSATNNGLSTTLNADEAVARGAALQSAILSPRFKVLPYEIIECNNYPVKVSWDGESDGEGGTNSVIMFDRGSNFNVVRRVTLRRSGEFIVQASYDDSASKYGYPEGISKDIVAFKIKAIKGSDDSKIRVNVKQDIHGKILLSSAQMVEEIVEEAKDEEMKDAEPKEGEEAKKEDAKPEKKKKVVKTNLEYKEIRSLEWTESELVAYNEKEVSMSNIDRIVKETSDMRNELESYVYSMRDKIISDRDLASYGTDEEKSEFTSILETTENWLYEDGFDAKKSAFVEKLTELKKYGDPIEKRKYEAAGRPSAMNTLQRTIEKFQSWVNTSTAETDYAHITEEEWTKCREICDSTSTWMYEAMDKQGSLTPCDNPMVTIADINAKTNEISKTINPIMHKPKPKVEEKPKEEEKPAEEKETEPMDTEETPAAEEAKETEPMDTN